MLNKSKYADFLVRDFLCDEHFQNWVLHPDPEQDRFWQQWILLHPDKEPLIAVAKETLLSLEFKVVRPSAEKVRESLRQTLAIINELEKSGSGLRSTQATFTDAGLPTANDYAEEKAAPPAKTLHRVLTRLAIAASILLVFGLGWKLLVADRSGASVAATKPEKKDSLTFVVRHEINKTGSEKKVALPDGSLILLANNSEVTYQEPFAGRRNITLRGKALFDVAEDKTNPFEVTSGDISTTALGTRFTVTTFDKTDKVIVRLYEGKIVIKARNKSRHTMKDDVFLLPGQAFVYSGKTTGKVKAFNAAKTASRGKIIDNESALDNPSILADNGVPWFQFNNQQLGQVLTDLGALYGVEIEFDKRDVGNIYFTRKYKRTSSLETILKEISTLHNLTISKTEKGYSLKK